MTSTVGWTCPDCGRTFARSRQSHECAPAMPLEEYFATGHERERAIFEAVYEHVASLGPVQVEPVSVGIFIKRGGSYLELRPKTKWVALSFSLDRTLHDPRIARKVIPTGERRWHVVNLHGPEDVDDVVKDWLTEAYFLR